jgi:hypothetical protein
MEVGPVAKVADPDLYQTVNNLKTTGIEYLKNPNQRSPMTAKKKTVIAKFEYYDAAKDQPFYAIRSWPCQDQAEAELIVKYYGMKTGSVEAQCNIKEPTDEKDQLTQTETIAA